MVDPSLVDFRSVSDEVRFRFFNYLWGRGVRSSELGVDPTYADKIKTLALHSRLYSSLQLGSLRALERPL